MKHFFRQLITRDYRFNAIFILVSVDAFLASSVWFLFFRPEQDAEKITRNLIASMIIFSILSLVSVLTTLNKMKRIRQYEQEVRAEALRKKQVAAREKLKNS